MARELPLTIDGNQAAAHVAYMTNEVIAIYPITPASPMGEWADQWAAENRHNLWGSVPRIVEMQSEAGAAGTIHGSLQSGALTTTFTASQGLLLMIPNMYKIAGELSPAVFHVASRSLAAQALSIFGDHSDVMAARTTGFAFLASNSVQEVMDFALIAQAATLEARLPIVHFFDGFRTSHEISKINPVEPETMRALIQDELIHTHRRRALSPEHPVLRGSSQNPDIYFQARETVNPYYTAMPGIVQSIMNRFAELTGRQYRLFDYAGAEDAERVIVLMGSGAETAAETVEYLHSCGEKVGLLKVRLFRPFSPEALLTALPVTVRSIAVLDRTKEPGADGEPLYKDVLAAVAQDYSSGSRRFTEMPHLIGGRFGLSSKEFTPGMVRAIFNELGSEQPKNHFTTGIFDDVTHSSLVWDPAFRTDANKVCMSALFYGLGSDGTVSANKNSIKIIGEKTDRYVQGYFVYDSKKAGAVTISHLRFGSRPIRSSYLIGEGDADFVACHQSIFLNRYEMLKHAKTGGIFLLNAHAGSAKVWDSLPRDVQQIILEKKLTFYTIDAYSIAERLGLGNHINTIMQACFFVLSGILPRDEAITAIKDAAQETYARAGQRIAEANIKAIDAAVTGLEAVAIPAQVSSGFDMPPPVPASAPDFVQRVTGNIIAGKGDEIPVSLLPADGTYPTGTAAWEKRNLALKIPVWESDLCTQCGKCVFVCPHSAIRSKVVPATQLEHAPESFKHAAAISKAFEPAMHFSYQIAPEDCTGCGLCADVCPIRDRNEPGRKALNMSNQAPILEQERKNWAFFLDLPDYDRSKIRESTLPGAMLLQPLFEFSGACEGCGETPYLRLLSQLFGDHIMVANATGCSSIYGGNLPATPWTKNSEGRGPAWSNSLFEDNAEFGFGMRTAVDKLAQYARETVQGLNTVVGETLANEILSADQSDAAGIEAQRDRVNELRKRLSGISDPAATALDAVAEYLIKRSVWIVGGDGWGYDIGYGGLDHLLASGSNVNILILDTEVYSNTGGQTSKATPRGAVAKFSAAGKPTRKKDLARIAIGYEHVYVAQVAFGAKDTQTLHAFLEADSYEGPSLIIAYSPCIAHGVDLSNNLRQQNLAMRSGHWPLLRYDPRRAEKGKNPMHLDSAKPSIPFQDYAATETRFSLLWRTHPEAAEKLMRQAQADVDARYNHYQERANRPNDATEANGEEKES